MRVIAGISTRPPKQSQVAMPVSSQTRYRTFGEFSGAVGAAYGPQSGSESRMSSSILPLNSDALDAFDTSATCVDITRDSYQSAEILATIRESPRHAFAC